MKKFTNKIQLTIDELYERIAEYIKERYLTEEELLFRLRRPISYCIRYPHTDDVSCETSADFSLGDDVSCEKSEGFTLVDMLAEMDDSFAVTLLRLIDLKGMTDVECYKKANVSKQTWYKIMNEKDYRPSKNTVLSFAIALELSLEEAKRLLSTVGFALSRSSKFDIIIEFFLATENYDIFLINETLFKFDQPCLSV